MIRLKVRAEYPDQVVEEKESSFRVQFNLDIATKIKGETTPEIKGIVRFINHEIKVTLSNRSRNVLGKSFRVLSVSSTEFPDVAFYLNSGDFGTLQKDQSKTVELRDEIRNKSYKGKTIPLEFVYQYGDSIELKREKFVITPTN